jgi:hypothetical protein
VRNCAAWSGALSASEPRDHSCCVRAGTPGRFAKKSPCQSAWTEALSSRSQFSCDVTFKTLANNRKVEAECFSERKTEMIARTTEPFGFFISSVSRESAEKNEGRKPLNECFLIESEPCSADSSPWAASDVKGRGRTIVPTGFMRSANCRVSPCWPRKQPRVGLATAAREHGPRKGSDGNSESLTDLQNQSHSDPTYVGLLCRCSMLSFPFAVFLFLHETNQNDPCGQERTSAYPVKVPCNRQTKRYDEETNRN